MTDVDDWLGFITFIFLFSGGMLSAGGFLVDNWFYSAAGAVLFALGCITSLMLWEEMR